MKAFVFPGQGAQRLGMGAELFARFPDEVAMADALLGYSIEELCTQDPHGRLDSTEYTQPALYVVNALHYLDRNETPDYVAGHSLGEYDALFAAGAFDFATGLRLVQRRGQLMAKARGGGMAAVMGIAEDDLREILDTADFRTVDIANLNSPGQIVISGLRADVERAAAHLTATCDAHVVMLRVSGAFHSRYMAEAAAEFRTFASGFRFQPLRIPLFSNAFALPYQDGEVAETLAAQMASPVRWMEIISTLLSFGITDIQEVGPGRTLSSLVRQVKAHAAPTSGVQLVGNPAAAERAA